MVGYQPISRQGFGVGKTVIRTTCTRIRQMKISGMRLHGQFWSRVDGIADIGLSFLWLSSSTLQATTESIILAAQDQALRTRNYEWGRLCRPILEQMLSVAFAMAHWSTSSTLCRHVHTWLQTDMWTVTIQLFDIFTGL